MTVSLDKHVRKIYKMYKIVITFEADSAVVNMSYVSEYI